MRSMVLTIGVTICSLPTVHADECVDKATAQVGMDCCAANAYRASDAELNRIYREIERRLSDDATTRRLLVATQRAWLTFRDAECAFAASGAEGGSAYPMVHNQCLDGLTRMRIDGLRHYLRYQEGDLGCPVPPAN